MIDQKLQKQLRKAMILVFLIIAIVFVIGGLFSTYLYNSRQDSIHAQVIAEVEEYKNRIMKQLEADFQTLSTLSAFLDSDNTADKERLSQRLDASNQSNSFLTLIYFDLDGTGVISTLGQDPIKDASLSDLSEEGRRVVELALKGENAVSKMFQSAVSGNQVFVYSVPVYDGDTIIGALAASDHMEIFADILSGNTVFGGGGYIHLLSSSGTFLVRSSKTVVKADIPSLFDGPYLSGESRETVRKALENGERVFSSFNYEGKSYPFLLEPVGLNDWYLFCVNTGEGLTANFNTSALVTEIVFALILILLLFFMLYGYRLLRNYNKSLTRLAYCDPITGAENISRFRQRLLEILPESGGAVVKFSIRQFSFLNEIFGNEKTTRLLCQITETAGHHFHSGEFFCHHTEDIFYFFLAETDEQTIRSRLDTFLQELGHKTDISQTNYQLAFYCGVALSQGGGDPEQTADILMTHVQFALNKAEGSHSNFIWFFDSELHKQEELENYIESHMHQALAKEEFKLFLQPKKNLKTGELESAEALVRWKPDDGRLLFPNQFIPLFEQNGFCVELDLYMVEQACRLIRSWIDCEIVPIPISVNQSKLLFFEPDYVQTLEGILERYQVSPKFIILEILEGLALENVEELNEKISQLQEAGFRISLDDFGSGYSSMNTLSRLKINELKLDRGFLLSAAGPEHEKSRLIMGQIIQLSHQLDISTVSEGVETAEDEEFIRSIGCDVGQGYFYHRPISAKEFHEIYMAEPGKRSMNVSADSANPKSD